MIHVNGTRSCDGCGVVADILLVQTVYAPKPFHDPVYKIETCLQCQGLARLTLAITRGDRRQAINGLKEKR